MSEYMFGVTHEKLSKTEVKRRDRIARKHGFCFVYCNLPGEGLQGWFAGPNKGEPFDSSTAREIRAELGL